MTIENKKGFIINIVFITIVSIIIYFSIRFLLIYLFPLIIGLTVTFLIERPSKFISDKIGIKKGIVALCLVVASYVILTSVLVLIVLKFGHFISFAAIKFENNANEIINLANGIIDNIPKALKESAVNMVNGFISSATKYITSIAKNTATVMPMFITSVIVTVIASCYIAKDFDGFKASINSVIKPKHKIAISEFKSLMSENIFKIIKGYGIISIITFFEVAAGLILLRVNNAVVLSTIIALVDIMPIFGTGLILIPWGIVEIVKNNIFLGVGLLILYAIIVIVRNIIEPKIIGKQIGLHPLIMLISVFVGLRVFGFVGIIVLPLGLMIVWKMYERGIFDILFSRE